PKTDAYSLGCVMWEALVGHPPLAGDTAIETLLLHQHQEPVSVEVHNAEIPPALVKIIDGLLKKDPDIRPDLTESVLPELELLCMKLREGNPIKSAEPSADESPTKRHSLNAFMISSIVLSLCIGVVAFFLFNQPDVSKKESGRQTKGNKFFDFPDLQPSSKQTPGPSSSEVRRERERRAKQRAEDRKIQIDRFNKAYDKKDCAEVVNTGIVLARDSAENHKSPVAEAELFEKIGWGYEGLHKPRDAFQSYQRSLDCICKAPNQEKLKQLVYINSSLRTGYGLKEVSSEQRDQWLQQSESLALELLGENSTAYAHELLFYGDLTAHDHPTAVRYYRRCLDCLRTARPHPNAPSVSALRGQCLISLGRGQMEFEETDQAIISLQQAVKVLAKEKNLDFDLRVSALDADIKLADLLMQKGRFEDSYKATDYGVALSKVGNPPNKYRREIIIRRRSAFNMMRSKRKSSR
ncbi:MAG: hypothetical protein K2X93_25720, partial [Candidatus Obscuribacterales bacterium]|nr:hypothetical protein [Candidatus Obscuribacterales bacterium]